MTTAAPTTAPPISACDDYFTGSNGDPLNSSKWTVIQGSPEIQSNTGELLDGDIVLSTITYPTDFNVEVDFALQSPPVVGYFNAILYAYIDSDTYIAIGVSANAGVKSFACLYKNGIGTSAFSNFITRSNDTGRLGVERLGNNIRAYYRDGAGAETDFLKIGRAHV